MNYLKHYERLIERAQTRSILPGEYFEKHHIVPRCMNGTDDIENIVKLFPEEHYIAHQLLVKMYPTNPKLVYALIIMTGKRENISRNNKMYGWLKKRVSIAKTGKKYSEESKQKMSDAARKRKPMSEETRKKMSLSRTGKSKGPMSAEQKKKISNTKQANPKSSPTKGRIVSEETKEKLRQANLGKHHTEETKKKISENHSNTSWNKGILQPKLICPHCNKIGGSGGMHQWHFDNCKMITHIQRL